MPTEHGTPTNAERANSTEIPLAMFCEWSGQHLEDEEDCADAIADFICNLGHYADTRGLDFKELLCRGAGMWSAEKRHPIGDPYINDVATLAINDENPFDPESPEGRAWDAGDRSSVEVPPANTAALTKELVAKRIQELADQRDEFEHDEDGNRTNSDWGEAFPKKAMELQRLLDAESLISMDDEGVSFEEIAAYIRQHREDL